MKAPAQPPLRVILADDEGPALNYLKEQLLPMAEIKIVAECQNGFEAVRACADSNPDLLFLDVQMPKLDGFEVCELIDPHIVVIFVTAYDQYALKAFEIHAVDYLLKPFSSERLYEALSRAKDRLGKNPVAYPSLSASARPGSLLSRLVVKDGADIVFIPVDKLDYLEAQGDYVAVHSQGKSWLKNQAISTFETVLEPNRFVRIHRSAIVNLERIAQIHPYSKDDKLAILKDGTRLPISRSGYKKLRELWEPPAS